ncbi:carbon-nitrogen hydrolase family protein [Spiractinospora alimapuensis]|uniref:carbon-nitrogen hydrolase family protein n=1 Tax=Spiractinospora alimapuensis TaxID=2820884 RepID=UPI001F3CB012|nr:carbon-nitrogen hydrolase family protein [Spiractinospora alimapuensis]
MKVAVAQFAPTEDKTANLRTAEGLVRQAAERGARVVVLPEYTMFTAPRTDTRFVTAAEPLDGPFMTGLRGIARRLGLVVVAGVNESTSDPDLFTNRLVALDERGELVASYQKLHLYDAFGARESDVVRPGDIAAPETFTVDDTVFGLQTCYDLRFPEVTRRIVDAGADVLLMGAQWVPGPLKEDHWVTLLRARAIENTLYVAAAAQNAPTGAGRSMIVDPMGAPIASLAEETGVAVGHVRQERTAEVRERNPALRVRRFAVTARPTNSTTG